MSPRALITLVALLLFAATAVSVRAAAPADILPRLVLQSAHAHVITTLDHSARGLLASGSLDQTVRLWDARSGRLLWVAGPLGSRVDVVRFFPDGRRLAVLTANGVLQVLDVAAGTHLRSFRPEGFYINPHQHTAWIEFSPDGSRLAASSLNAGCEGRAVVDSGSGRIMGCIRATVPSNVSFAARTPRGAIASGQHILLFDDRFAEIRRWDAGRLVSTVAISGDGRRIAALLHPDKPGGRERVQVWNADTAEVAGTLPEREGIGTRSLRYGADDRLFMLTRDAAEWWDADGSIRLAAVEKAYIGSAAAAPTADGRRLYTALFSGQSSGGIHQIGSIVLPGSAIEPFPTATFPPKNIWRAGDELITLTLGRFARWNVAGGATEHFDYAEYQHDATVAQGRLLSNYGTGYALHDLETGKLLWRRHNMSDPGVEALLGSCRVQLAPDAGVAALHFCRQPGKPDQIVLMNMADGKERARFTTGLTDIESLTALQFSADGRQLGLVSNQGRVRLHDLARPEDIRVLQPLQWPINANYQPAVALSDLAFGPDGSWIAAASDRGLAVWDSRTGQLAQRLHEDRVGTAVAPAPDGRGIAVAWDGGTISLVDPAWRETTRLSGGHQGGRVLKLLFAPDGRHLYSMGMDGMIVLWDLRTRRWVARLTDLRDGTWVVTDPEGRFDTNNLEDLRDLHWVMPDDPLAPLPLEIFMRDYYEPRLLARIIAGQPQRPVRALGTLNRAQPVVAVTAIERVGPDRVNVTVQAGRGERTVTRNGRPHRMVAAVHDLRLFRDGQLVARAPDAGGAVQLDAAGAARVKFENVRLPSGRDAVEFSAYAFNQDRVKSTTARQRYAVSPELAGRGARAYVITIGVNTHENAAWNLDYAANDARILRDTLTRELGARRGFSEIVALSLISGEGGGDARATKENIRRVLARLGGKPDAAGGVPLPGMERLVPATPDDLVLITFAGHGFPGGNGSFYLLPEDTGPGPGRGVSPALRRRSIEAEELAGWLRDVDAGLMAMIIDACHSASAVEAGGFVPGPMGSRGLGQLAFDKGMLVLAASQTDGVAVELPELRQGVLSYVLVRDGLETGRADFSPADQRILLTEWLAYGAQRVPELMDDYARGRLRGLRMRGLVADPGLKTAAQNKRAPRQQPALFRFAPKGTDVLLQVR